MNYRVVPTPWGDRTALNLTRVITDDAGVVYLSAAQFYRIGQVNMGIQIQAVGASVTPSFTLAPPELALDLDQVPGAVPWTPMDPTVAGGMTLYPLATTAIRLEFSGAGEATVISW